MNVQKQELATYNFLCFALNEKCYIIVYDQLVK